MVRSHHMQRVKYLRLSSLCHARVSASKKQYAGRSPPTCRGARGILSGTSLTEGGKDSKTGRDSGNWRATRVPRGALLVSIRDLQQQPIVKRLTGLPL